MGTIYVRTTHVWKIDLDEEAEEALRLADGDADEETLAIVSEALENGEVAEIESWSVAPDYDEEEEEEEEVEEEEEEEEEDGDNEEAGTDGAITPRARIEPWLLGGGGKR